MISGLYRFEPMVTSHMRRTCQSKTAHLMTGKQNRIKWPGPYSSPGRHIPDVVTLYQEAPPPTAQGLKMG